MGHKYIGQDGQAGQNNGQSLRGSPSNVVHTKGSNQLGWDIDGPKSHLDKVDAETKVLKIHDEPIVGEASSKPDKGV